jgi:DNA polymerase-3 subunit alpha
MVNGKSLTMHYIDRKHGIDSVVYLHDALEPILQSTQGILVYQEQAMRIATEIGGFDLQEADTLRKAIGKKQADMMAQVKTSFLEKSVDKGIVNKEQAEEIFSWIEKSQRYSFNKSHSVSYAYNSYLTAYAKAHFPREFFTAYLNAVFELKNSSGDLVMHKSLDRVKGVQTDKTRAGQEAYRKATKEIETRFIESFIKALYK